jgi:hypothetical protein
LLAAPAARAVIFSVSGSGITIAPPALIGNADSTNNSFQQGFNERQGVFLIGPLAVDGGSIGGGVAVDSHMIFFNRSGSGELSTTATWTFSGTILGVMSDINGTLEAASTSFLGSPTTGGYPAPGGFTSRGMEPSSPDGYSGVGTSSLMVTMTINQPGDWIRVITRATPDGGSTAALLGLGLLFLPLARRWAARAR